MRILFASYAERTHFYSMVPLAWALAAAGHDVRVAGQASLKDAISGAGLTAVPVGGENNLWRVLRLYPQAEEMARSQVFPPFGLLDLPEEERTYAAFRSGYEQVVRWWWRLTNDPMVDGLVAFARAWRPQLVIWEAATFAGALAAAAVGAAHARVTCSLDLYGAAREQFLRLSGLRPPAERSDPLAEWLGARAAKVGVPFGEEMVTGHFTVEQLPASMRVRTDLRYVPMRYTPYNGVAVVPRWLWEPPARPRVCVTLGTMNAERLGGSPISVREALDALADLEVEVVATVPDAERDRLGAVPANATVVPRAPLYALAGSAAAVVHHGGWGTMNTTALHGVPQLTLAQQFDAPVRGRLLAAQGAGLCLPPERADAAAVRERVTRLLGEASFREGAAGLRDEMLSMPTPRAVAAEVVRLAAEHLA
ncbi:activator-dependent family glycosyltransferase [Sphaerisporangium dianthi]|uniref:Activator-dependent family glycosyltransferase n=1 Tax=Sphaerisporangium dianthi TaxID=1436120 RepID=A0ABV9CU28_9ACTN